MGLGIGGVSALVAIGGGSLSVPFMTWCNVKMQNAIGTSAAIGLPIALSGTLGYVVNGWGRGDAAIHRRLHLPAGAGAGHLGEHVYGTAGRAAGPHPAGRGAQKVFAGLLMLLSLKMLHSVFGA